MKTYIRRREKNNHLVIFFGGWGPDEHVFTPLCNDEFDFILFYNYSADEALVLPEMKRYQKITLIGWSLGVWAAEHILPKTGIRPDISIAVNGTPLPADDKYGIPLSEFEGTLNNITEENIEKFYVRMFGDKKTYLTNIDRIPYRTLKSLHDELRWMYNRIMEQKEPGFRWDFAVTSNKDRVFPSRNLDAYWGERKETKHIVLPLPHYFFHKWKSFTDFISFVENFSDKSSKPKSSSPRNTKDL
jgi:pimeloyl-[acyl-carrier protein] methyl ester esterase